MNSKSKNTLILLISLIVLVGIYFIWQNPFDSSRNQIQTENILDQALSQAQKIEISRTTASTVLAKNDSTWVVASDNNKPANEALIEDLLSTLTENKTATIVSLSADNLEKYGLNEEAASKLQISDGQNNLLANLLIGKIGGPDYTGTYVKKADTAKILLIDKNISSKIEQPNWLQPDKPVDTSPQPSNINL